MFPLGWIMNMPCYLSNKKRSLWKRNNWATAIHYTVNTKNPLFAVYLWNLFIKAIALMETYLHPLAYISIFTPTTYVLYENSKCRCIINVHPWRQWGMSYWIVPVKTTVTQLLFAKFAGAWSSQTFLAANKPFSYGCDYYIKLTREN